MSNAPLSWLLKAKVLAPELPSGYVRRAPLLQRLDGLPKRRLTVMQAPAGFGKTTLLADIACAMRERGVIVGWITLDDDDTPNVFGSYLAYAFEHAGLDTAGLRMADIWLSSPAVKQIGMLVRAIESHEAPCLLVLDEVERLPRRTVELVDLLLRCAPRNLHLAMALRYNPGVGVTAHVLNGGAVVIGAEDLRFSKADTARYFGGALSQAKLDAVDERTAGWPFALPFHRNTRTAEASGLTGNAAQLAENYIRVRLLRDVSEEDRVRLFDLAVFDRIDAGVVDAVLGSSDARMRVAALPSLNGLLPPVEGDPAVRRLHPLLKDYCLDALAAEAPARKRTLHKRIALELARRGQLTAAWRHAGATGDGQLVSELIERFGACRLWLREGVLGLNSAGRLLTAESTVLSPRLALLRCVNLCLAWKWDEAAALFAAISQRTDGFARDRDGGDSNALAIDRFFAQGALAGGGERLPPGKLETCLPAGDLAAAGDERDRIFAYARHIMLCVSYHERARFAECRRHGLQAHAHAAEDTRFGDAFADTYLGMSAMAQGRVEEAGKRYRLARQVSRKFFPSDPCLAVSTDVLAIELDLERNRERPIRQRTLQRITQLPGVWVDVYFAAVAVSAELMFGRHGTREAIQLLATTVDQVRATGIENLSNSVAALLAYYLSESGRPDEAGQVWRENGLPCDVAALLDIERQSWRTMEALSCARVRLLAEQGECAAAEELAGGLCAVASEHGLTRSLLRGLALSMAVASRAGQPERALTHLVEFLRAARGVGYIRPLVRHREVSRTVLQRLLATDADDDVRAEAESVLAHLGEPSTPAAQFFSTRELEVLAEVARGLQDKEVAGRLGITGEGVRYHLKNINRKTGAGNRADAVRYARSLGVLP